MVDTTAHKMNNTTKQWLVLTVIIMNFGSVEVLNNTFYFLKVIVWVLQMNNPWQVGWVGDGMSTFEAGDGDWGRANS